MKKPDITKMSLRQKVAQTLLVRQSDLLMRAEKDYAELRAPKEAKEILETNCFGGIWTHGNTDVNGMSPKYNGYFKFTTRTMAEWIKKNTVDMEIPPICADDPGSCLDLSQYPMGLIVGAANSEEYAYELGRCIASEHKCAGINWLWNPNIDIVGHLNPCVVRPFANEKEKLKRLAIAYLEGMQSVGFAATLKHFPGEDDKETRDSHIVTTVIKTPVSEWEKEQGSVFRAGIDAGVYAIMNSARIYPEMDGTKIGSRPAVAGLSSGILIDKLKGEMGFDGVVITDDVTMGGYTSYYESDELYARFLEAGNDMLLGVGVDALDKVMKCVERRMVTEERINDACRRVLDLKEKVGLFDDDYIRGGNIEEAAQKTYEITKKIASKGVTLLRDNVGFFKEKKALKQVTIFTFSHKESIYDDLKTMKKAFELRGAEVELKKEPKSFAEVEEAAKRSDLIIYAGYIGFHAPKGAPSFYGDTFWSLRYAFTAGKEKSIGISLGYPYIHHYFMDDAEVFVNLYTPHKEVQKAFVSAVYGEIEFSGVAPLDMECVR